MFQSSYFHFLIYYISLYKYYHSSAGCGYALLRLGYSNIVYSGIFQGESGGCLFSPSSLKYYIATNFGCSVTAKSSYYPVCYCTSNSSVTDPGKSFIENYFINCIVIFLSILIPYSMEID